MQNGVCEIQRVLLVEQTPTQHALDSASYRLLTVGVSNFRIELMTKYSISLPFFDLDTSDPLVKSVIFAMESNPHDAEKIAESMWLNYEPYRSQLLAYVRTHLDLGLKPPHLSLSSRSKTVVGEIQFDKNVGEIKVGDQLVGRLPLGTREFYLFVKLYENRGKVVGYKSLYDFIRSVSRFTQVNDPSNYCHKLRGELSKKIWGVEIDHLIKADRLLDGTRGYRLLTEAEIAEK